MSILLEGMVLFWLFAISRFACLLACLPLPFYNYCFVVSFGCRFDGDCFAAVFLPEPCLLRVIFCKGCIPFALVGDRRKK